MAKERNYKQRITIPMDPPQDWWPLWLRIEAFCMALSDPRRAYVEAELADGTVHGEALDDIEAEARRELVELSGAWGEAPGTQIRIYFTGRFHVVLVTGHDETKVLGYRAQLQKLVDEYLAEMEAAQQEQARESALAQQEQAPESALASPPVAQLPWWKRITIEQILIGVVTSVVGGVILWWFLG